MSMTIRGMMETDTHTFAHPDWAKLNHTVYRRSHYVRHMATDSVVRNGRRTKRTQGYSADNRGIEATAHIAHTR